MLCLLGTKTDVEDIVQETWSRLLRVDVLERDETRARSYMFKVATLPDRRSAVQIAEQPNANPFAGQIAPQLVPVLRPMLSQAAQMAASPGNRLIIVDYYDNVRRISAIVEAIVADFEE